jgi:ferredoxin
MDHYQQLAVALDALPAGFPPTSDGAELRVLAKLFTPDEAALAARLGPTLETADAIARRTGRNAQETRAALKGLARRGLIAAGRTEGGLGYGLMPFVVGFYEQQNATLDVELARLVEDYFLASMPKALAQQPQAHRVIPVDRTIQNDVEVHPYECAADILRRHQAWGVIPCICRKQKALIGDPCTHPVDACLIMSETPGAFDSASGITTLTLEGALGVLRRAAEAGLVHTVNNSQRDVSYICNCCTCSCGILRGMADLGMANVVARSAFVNRVDEERCEACGLCVESCQFSALALDASARVDARRCVGCGACVLVCPEEALALVRRPADEVLPPPETQADWERTRLAARGLSSGR